MSTIRTNFDQREDARRWRFEPSVNIPDTNVQAAIERVSTNPPSITSTPITVASSPYAVLAADSVLYVDSSAGAVTINLQQAAARNGKPIEIYDIAGHAATNNISIVPNAADTGAIEGINPLKIEANYGGFKLYPATLKYKIAA